MRFQGSRLFGLKMVLPQGLKEIRKEYGDFHI